MKIVKIITLPITIPLAFLVIGIIGATAFVVLLFDEKKRQNLFGI